MRDNVVWSNNLDMVPFLSAVAKTFRVLGTQHGYCLQCKCAISVPGLSLRYFFLTLSDDTYFSLIDSKTKICTI